MGFESGIPMSGSRPQSSMWGKAIGPSPETAPFVAAREREANVCVAALSQKVRLPSRLETCHGRICSQIVCKKFW